MDRRNTSNRSDSFDNVNTTDNTCNNFSDTFINENYINNNNNDIDNNRSNQQTQRNHESEKIKNIREKRETMEQCDICLLNDNCDNPSSCASSSSSPSSFSSSSSFSSNSNTKSSNPTSSFNKNNNNESGSSLEKENTNATTREKKNKRNGEGNFHCSTHNDIVNPTTETEIPPRKPKNSLLRNFGNLENRKSKFDQQKEQPPSTLSLLSSKTTDQTSSSLNQNHTTDSITSSTAAETQKNTIFDKATCVQPNSFHQNHTPVPVSGTNSTNSPTATENDRIQINTTDFDKVDVEGVRVNEVAEAGITSTQVLKNVFALDDDDNLIHQQQQQQKQQQQHDSNQNTQTGQYKNDNLDIFAAGYNSAKRDSFDEIAFSRAKKSIDPYSSNTQTDTIAAVDNKSENEDSFDVASFDNNSSRKNHSKRTTSEYGVNNRVSYDFRNLYRVKSDGPASIAARNNESISINYNTKKGGVRGRFTSSARDYYLDNQSMFISKLRNPFTNGSFPNNKGGGAGNNAIKDGVSAQTVTDGENKSISGIHMLRKPSQRRATSAELIREFLGPADTPVNARLFGGKKAVQVEIERAKSYGYVIHPCSKLRFVYILFFEVVIIFLWLTLTLLYPIFLTILSS